MKLLFIGDSLIEYFHWQGRFPDHNVSNLGIAGESVGGLLSRIAGIKEVCSEAEMIFIMAGVNNIAMDDHDFFDEYKEIIEKLLKLYPGSKIFIHSLLTPLVDFISDESIQRTNDSLKKLAEDTGTEYVDIHRRFIDTKGKPIKEYLLDDGVHVSSTGYAVWSKAVEEIIKLQ